MPDTLQIIYHGVMAMVLGLLIGLEREHSRQDNEPLVAGIRTFPLIALIGFVSGLAAKGGYGWVAAVALAGVSAMAVVGYWVKSHGPHKGATTELVIILAFVLGGLTAFGYLVPAATFAVLATLLLSFKAPLHHLAEKIREGEIYAILEFCVISVIVLPLLPNRTFGPYQVLNPRLIWWIVVLISGISMVGYLLMRFWGARQGIAVTGLLGGLVSSTATTLGLSQKSREAEGSSARYFALGIVVASTIMFFRVFVLTMVIDLPLARTLALPIVFPALVGMGASFYLWRTKGVVTSATLEVKNPMELGAAIQFALLFAVVLFVARAAQFHWGAAGVYVTSALAGLTDADTITVSSARLARDQILANGTATASILLACAMNTLLKGGLAVVIGGKSLRAIIVPIFLTLFLTCLWLLPWLPERKWFRQKGSHSPQGAGQESRQLPSHLPARLLFVP
jgi:uncharacterized membrane protein (DUF4010 family)